MRPRGSPLGWVDQLVGLVIPASEGSKKCQEQENSNMRKVQIQKSLLSRRLSLGGVQHHEHARRRSAGRPGSEETSVDTPSNIKGSGPLIAFQSTNRRIVKIREILIRRKHALIVKDNMDRITDLQG